MDMLFGLLNLNIREKIPRDSVDSFDKLLTAARIVERTMDEKSGLVTEKAETAQVPVTNNAYKKV